MSLSFSELTDAQHLYFSNRIWLLNLQPVHIRASPTDLLRLPWPERHWIMAQMCLKTPQRAQHLKNCTSFNHSFDHSFNHSFNHQIHLNMLNTVLGVPGNIWKSCLSRMLRIYENNVRSQFNHRLHRLQVTLKHILKPDQSGPILRWVQDRISNHSWRNWTRQNQRALALTSRSCLRRLPTWTEIHWNWNCVYQLRLKIWKPEIGCPLFFWTFSMKPHRLIVLHQWPSNMLFAVDLFGIETLWLPI